LREPIHGKRFDSLGWYLTLNYCHMSLVTTHRVCTATWTYLTLMTRNYSSTTVSQIYTISTLLCLHQALPGNGNPDSILTSLLSSERLTTDSQLQLMTSDPGLLTLASMSQYIRTYLKRLNIYILILFTIIPQLQEWLKTGMLC
jgi:hypothetical protein